jgi:hypothetical protein
MFHAFERRICGEPVNIRMQVELIKTFGISRVEFPHIMAICFEPERK